MGTVTTLMPLWKSYASGTWLSKNAILWDTFATPDAAPVTSPRTAEPGPGTGTFVQTDGTQGITNGDLVFTAQSTAVWGDQGNHWTAQTRAAGLVLYTPLTLSTWEECGVGWHTAGAVVDPDSAEHAIQANTTDGRFDDENGNAIVTGLSASTEYKLLQILRDNGCFYVVNGTLRWVSYTGNTATLYPMFSNLDGAGSLADIFVGDLSGYSSAWGGDWTEVTDTEVNQASKDYDCEANCHVTGSFTCENTKFIYIYIRYTDGDNWVRLSIGTDRVVKLEKNVATSTTTVATGSTLTDAVEYQYDLVANGSAVEGFINCISDVSGAITDHATVAQGRLEHDLASNDLDVTSHPTPALGIADSRIICPQADDTWTHSDDLVAEIKNITLPSAANMNFFFRTTPVLVCYADGSAILWEDGNQRISTGAGTVSDGDDIVLVFEGVNAQVFVNGSSIGTTSALTALSGSGRLEFAGVTDGTADHIACFPRDLTSLLPPDVR